MTAFADPPLIDSVVMAADPREQSKLPEKLVMTPNWVKYLGERDVALEAAPAQRARERLTGVHASIGTTPLNTGTLAEGRYRVSYWFKVNTPASSSSSWQFTLTWLRNGTVLTFTGAAVTSNALTSYQSAPIEVYVDADTPISYAVAYVSVGGTNMAYELDVLVERLAEDSL